jgi:hypothetical protein
VWRYGGGGIGVRDLNGAFRVTGNEEGSRWGKGEDGILTYSTG